MDNEQIIEQQENVQAFQVKNDRGETNTVNFSLMHGSIVKSIREYKIKELRRKKESGEYNITEEQIKKIEEEFKAEEEFLDLTS